jgi:hypothetical protein
VVQFLPEAKELLGFLEPSFMKELTRNKLLADGNM